MSISDKEAALKLIEQLPDDATPAEISEAVAAWQHESRRDAADPGNNGTPRPSTATSDAGDVPSVPRRLVRKGFATVLEPTTPISSFPLEFWEHLIDDMRREREREILDPLTPPD